MKYERGRCSLCISLSLCGGRPLILFRLSGSPLQEIFQEAVQNHYLSMGFASPMIFFGEHYWTQEMPVYPLLQQLMTTGRYKNLLLSITDDIDDIIHTLNHFTPGHRPE